METHITQADRAAMVSFGEYLIQHNGLIHYAEERPMQLWSEAEVKTRFSKGESITMDCSWAVTEICYACGLLSPSGPGFGYDGYGNTQTMLNYLPHITDWNEVHAGTIIIFGGPMNLQHAVMVLEPNGDNPVVFSHGTEAGPVRTTLAYEATGHRGQPIIPLAIAGLGTTPVDTYHYLWFDDARVQLANDTNSERAVVENYDIARLKPVSNVQQLKKIKENLNYLIARIETNMKTSHDPHGKLYHRAWRLAQLKERAAGRQVVS
jgi:hypothetical protein